MSRYVVPFTMTISGSVVVEADSPKSAIEIARTSEGVEYPDSLCYQCSGGGEAWNLDLDGLPDVTRDPSDVFEERR